MAADNVTETGPAPSIREQMDSNFAARQERKAARRPLGGFVEEPKPAPGPSDLGAYADGLAARNAELLSEVRAGRDAREELASHKLGVLLDETYASMNSDDPERQWAALDTLRATVGLGNPELREAVAAMGSVNPGLVEQWIDTNDQLIAQAGGLLAEKELAQREAESVQHIEAQIDARTKFNASHPDAGGYEDQMLALAEASNIDLTDVAALPGNLELLYSAARSLDPSVEGSAAWSAAQSDKLLNISGARIPGGGIIDTPMKDEAARRLYAKRGMTVDDAGRVHSKPDLAGVVTALKEAKDPAPDLHTAEGRATEGERLSKLWFDQPSVQDDRRKARGVLPDRLGEVVTRVAARQKEDEKAQAAMSAKGKLDFYDDFLPRYQRGEL